MRWKYSAPFADHPGMKIKAAATGFPVAQMHIVTGTKTADRQRLKISRAQRLADDLVWKVEVVSNE